MQRYVVTIQDKETLARLETLGIVKYVPKLRDTYVFVETSMAPEELMALEGVLDCRKESIGRLCG